jgi:hypothetical protein
MSELILPYVVGFLVAQGLATIWFFSGFPIKLFSLLGLLKKTDEVYTIDEWEIWLMNKSDFFGELLTCPVCLSFWIGVIVSSTTAYNLDLGYWFIIVSSLSWPFLMYSSYKVLDK